MRIAYTLATPELKDPALCHPGPFAEGLRRIRDAGFDGVELYVRNPFEVDWRAIEREIAAAGLGVADLCTGAVYGSDGVSFGARDEAVRQEALRRTRAFIEVASSWGATVNVGRLRGRLPGPDEEPREVFEQRVLADFQEMGEHAARHGTALVLEPINRHEINFIHTLREGADWCRRVGSPGFALQADYYHLQLEEVSIAKGLLEAREWLRLVHICDSTRYAPGWGHADLKEFLGLLMGMGYDGWVSVEILQRPDPDAAVEQSGRHLRELLRSLEGFGG